MEPDPDLPGSGITGHRAPSPPPTKPQGSLGVSAGMGTEGRGRKHAGRVGALPGREQVEAQDTVWKTLLYLCGIKI